MPRDQTYFGASEFPYLEMGRSLSGSDEVREVSGDCGARAWHAALPSLFGDEIVK